MKSTWAVLAFFQTSASGWRERSWLAFLAICSRRSARNVRVSPLVASLAGGSQRCSGRVDVKTFGTSLAFKQAKNFCEFSGRALLAGVAAGNFEAARIASAAERKGRRREREKKKARGEEKKTGRRKVR
jgi:hypothetical protein